MTSAEKILAGIRESAEREAQEIIATAEQQAAERLTAARETAEREAAVIRTANERRAEVIRSTGKSGAALILRDASLACRRELIEDTLHGACERLCALPDGEYFDFLLRVVARCGCDTGELMLSCADSTRDRALFAERLSGTGLILSEQTVKANGGFVLKNGEIEINATFDALIHERHAELVDEVNRILFGA